MAARNHNVRNVAGHPFVYMDVRNLIAKNVVENGFVNTIDNERTANSVEVPRSVSMGANGRSVKTVGARRYAFI